MNLNLILLILNVGYLPLVLFSYLLCGESQYIGWFTVYLSILFALINIVMLSFEEKSRDPFVTILIAFATFFYLFRVVTLIFYPWSLVLSEMNVNSENIDHSLAFIIVSNVAIYAGLKISRASKPPLVDALIENKIYKIATLFIFLASLLLNVSAKEVETYVWFWQTLSAVIFPQYTILLIATVYFICEFDNLRRCQRIYFYIIYALFIISNTIIGSRSAILTLLTILLCAILAIKGRVLIQIKSLLALTALIPLLLFIFIAATHVRELGYNPKSTITEERLYKISDMDNYLNATGDVSFLQPIFDRAGYLTYAASIIESGSTYSQIINVEYYIKSIVDNLLTPGFYIFDAPKAANALRYYAHDIKQFPTIQDVIYTYSSDAMTVYGELYLLFGPIFGLLAMTFISYIFKTVYFSIAPRTLIPLMTYKTAVLYVFTMWLFSFGLDWLLIDIVFLFVPIVLLMKLYRLTQSVITFNSHSTR